MDKEKYCILENDGVALCVCKHRHCEQLQRAKAEIEELKKHQCSFENCDNFERYSTEIHELKQENSKLKGKLDAYKMSENEANEIIVEFKAENERLKETEKEISDFISDISTCGFKYDDRCPDNLDELQQCIEDLCDKFDNYKNTLEEIREELKEDTTCESRECGCDDYGECLNCLKETILTKINEVIGEE